MTAFTYFIYGLVFGSFYNVVIYRLPLDEKVAEGNSKCTHCGARIKYKYLIPVVSWIYLRGKSACCNQKISIMYPIIELATGIIFLLSYLIFGAGAISIYYISLLSFVLIVGIIDLQHKVIYDTILFLHFVFAIFMQVIFIGEIISSLMGSVIAYTCYYVIYYFSKKIYKEECFGLGDVLYITVVGFYLGNDYIFYIIFGPFYVALAYFIIAKLFFKSKLNLKSEIPFGPFISLTVFILTIVTNIL